MKTFLFFALVLTFNLSAKAESVPSVSCKGRFVFQKVKHSVDLMVTKVEGEYSMTLSVSAPEKLTQKWTVILENRFVLSRVQYYAYDPLRVKLYFNSVGFDKKGLLMSYALNDGKPFNIECKIDKEFY